MKIYLLCKNFTTNLQIIVYLVLWYFISSSCHCSFVNLYIFWIVWVIFFVVSTVIKIIFDVLRFIERPIIKRAKGTLLVLIFVFLYLALNAKYIEGNSTAI